VICDNAEMKKAFTVCFPGTEEEVKDGLDDAHMWNDVSVEEQEMMDRTLKSNQTPVFCSYLAVGHRGGA